jgi:hypothetical protein
MIGPMTYPRRNQYRHLFRAGRLVGLAVAAGACGSLFTAFAAVSFYWLASEHSYVAAVIALLLVGAIAGTCLLAAGGLLRSTAHPLALAERNRIGADSEDFVGAILQVLVAEGWRRRPSLNWPGVGDIDNAMISPNGEMAFAVETKTRTVLAEHLRRVYQQATWLCRRHRCRHGAVPVLVPKERRNLERFEHGVLIVSPDRLLASLRAAYRAACLPAG